MPVKLLNGRYAIDLDKCLGEGGAATVYQASDPTSGSQVAIKVFDGTNHGTQILAQFFERDMLTLEKCNHPNVLKMLEWGIDEESGQKFIVLELMPGNLKEKFPTGFEGWDDFYETIGAPLLDALVYLHTQRIAHRDLKPENILVSTDGTPKIADFSNAKWYDHDASHTVKDFASRPYTPPESYTKIARFSIDCWGFAAITASSLVGTWWTRNDRDTDVAAVLETCDLPQDIYEVLAPCLDPDPSRRPLSALKIKHAIDAIQHARETAIKRKWKVRIQLSKKCMDGAAKELGIKNSDQLNKTIESELDGRFGIALQPEQPNGYSDILELIGDRFTFLAKRHDDDANLLILISAQISGPQLMARKRLDCLELEGSVTFATPGSPLGNASKIDDVIDELESFYEAKAFRNEATTIESPVANWRAGLVYMLECLRRDTPRRRFRKIDVTKDETEIILYEDGYEFKIDDPIVLEDSSREKTIAIGTVSGVNGTNLTIRFRRKPLSEVPTEGVIAIDPREKRRQLERQIRALDEIEGEFATRRDIADVLMGRFDQDNTLHVVTATTPKDFDATGVSKLNESQQKAVALALAAYSIAAVQGPPGTGKTTFIAESIREMCSTNPRARILIASQTHIALDNALRQVGADNPGLRLLRLGRDASRIGIEAQQWGVEKQLNDWKDKVTAKSTAYLERWCQSKGISLDEATKLKALQRFVDARIEYERLHQQIKQLESEIPFSSEQNVSPPTVDPPENVSSTIAERAATATELRANIVDLKLDRTKWKGNRNKAASELVRFGAFESQRSAIATSLEELRKLLQGALLATSVDSGLDQLLMLQTEWLRRFGRTDDFTSVLISRAQVVGATCLGYSYYERMATSDFEVCILDEASKATAPEALVPMTRARRSILVGDTRQLPPFLDQGIIDHDELDEFGASEESLRESILDHLLPLLPESQCSSLTVQYRMDPAIGALVSDCFYGGVLTHGRTETDDHGLSTLLTKRVTWFSTSANPSHHEVRDGTTYSNPCESQLIGLELERLHFLYATQRENHGNINVAVITPYVRQQETLKRMLANISNACNRFVLGSYTVDTFQGQEADIILFSLTRSNTNLDAGFVNDERRLNVALSRARDYLVIVGDHTFVNQQSITSPLRRVLDYISAHPDECALVPREL